MLCLICYNYFLRCPWKIFQFCCRGLSVSAQVSGSGLSTVSRRSFTRPAAPARQVVQWQHSHCLDSAGGMLKNHSSDATIVSGEYMLAFRVRAENAESRDQGSNILLCQIPKGPKPERLKELLSQPESPLYRSHPECNLQPVVCSLSSMACISQDQCQRRPLASTQQLHHPTCQEEQREPCSVV